MTATYATEEDALRGACRTLGLSSHGLHPLRRHATSVYLLPREGCVARVSAWAQREALARSVFVTRWLAEHGLPVTEPIGVSQPIDDPPYVISFWRHYSQPEGPPPSAGDLGKLLRHLHDLPSPPVELPRYQPLAALQSIVQRSTGMAGSDRVWLEEAITGVQESYGRLHFQLGEGLLHGDAYPGNTLWDGRTALLGDWDEIAFGPREIDLANTYQGIRFGRTQQELTAFASAYQYDPARWPGLPVLVRMRDLHTLGSFIRRADEGDGAAKDQLAHRLGTLRSGERMARWDAY
ncbi:phosphotransferase [Streptomyces xiamenensis]|uniref:phosphotransferase n=1 Tax=Streptomyces xiamenensis TaxID=408015 RepID=UPI0036F01D4B